MLGDFINRCLILVLGYAYPGFECYKTVEKNRVDIEELRFWCKYWIIVALFTVLEKFADIFLAWLPMYGEMKLVLFLYLWYPKTKGTGYVYETVLRPFVSRHENDIDRKILECKARAWDYVIFYWQYFAQHGSSAFVQALQYLASQSTKFSPQKKDEQGESTINKMKQSPSLSKSKKWPPSPPSSPRSFKTVEVEYEEEEETLFEPDEAVTNEDARVRDRITRARARLRRLDSGTQQNHPRTPQRRESVMSV